MKGKKQKPYVKTIFFGVLSISLYAGLFMNVELVMDYFTRGGSYAALPIIAAFMFSFVHGAFASNTLDVIGLQPAKK